MPEADRAELLPRAHWLAMAILFTLMPFSCVFGSKGLVWIMLRDAPYAAQTFFILAVVCWIQFSRTRRKLRSSVSRTGQNRAAGTRAVFSGNLGGKGIAGAQWPAIRL
jgi:hypothetical protein